MLYKKYKPNKIQDFTGIQSVIQGLSEIPQCICFEGPPGRGKSAIAECLAKILVCENAGNNFQATPCGNCQPCLSPQSYIERINSSDIDIARMRDLSGRYGTENPFMPGRYVLVLEEFQELYKAKAAMNNALILFESLPENVSVIITTMDSSKMNAALKRRFVMITMPGIEDQRMTEFLIGIFTKEGREIQEKDLDAITSITEQAEGSAGVALSLLESYLLSGQLKTTTEEELRNKVLQLVKQDFAAMQWIRNFDSDQARALRAYMTNAVLKSQKLVNPRYMKIYFILSEALDSYGIDSKDRWRALGLKLFYD